MNNKAKLIRYIDALDFALYEMILFLDTHPDDRRALAAFENYRQKRKAAIREYESRFGNYVRKAIDVKPDGSWEWAEGPWPWEYKGEK